MGSVPQKKSRCVSIGIFLFVDELFSVLQVYFIGVVAGHSRPDNLLCRIVEEYYVGNFL